MGLARYWTTELRRLGMLAAAGRCVLLAALVLAPPGTQAEMTVLYDGSLGTSPSAQGWGLCTMLTFPSPPACGGPAAGASETVSNGAVTYDTTSNQSLYSGYFRDQSVLFNFPLPVTLDSSGAGFEVSFRARLDSETHVSANRAGFSVIVLDAAHKGVELGFWPDEVWAQSDAFSHAEGKAFDTQSDFADYALTLASGSYRLAMKRGPVAQTLNGTMRDYSGQGFPYTESNFMFFGDDTGSASASFTLASVSVTPVPEPETYALFLAGLATVAGALRRRRTTSAGAA
jgi:hypothetical protein